MVGSAKLRKREHEKKKGEQTGERKGGEDLSLSLPFSRHRSISFPRSRAHIFACLSLSRHPHYLRAWIEILQFALSDSILKHELSNEYKALNCPRSKKNGVHTGTSCPLLCPSTRSRLFIWAQAGITPEFYSVVLEKRLCSTSSLLEQHARAQLQC